MSKESWKIDFGKIMEVIDRLSNVGSKLKHTSSKLKVNAISNKRHFRNNDYRKVMKDQLVQLCNKYKQRLEQIECIFAHRERVMNISESNSDTVKIQNSLKNTWCESFKVNIPSQICLRRFTSCQVSVNRISGYKLRKYKLCSNSRHISSNTLLRSLSDGDDANSLRHKQREHTPKSVKFDLEMNTETSEKNNLNNQPEKTQNVHSSKEILCSQDSDNASHSHIGALKTENKAMQQCHNRSENIIIAEGEVHDRLSDQKSCSNETPIVHQHSDSQHRINKSMNNKNVHLNCKTNGENEEKISKRHTNKTASSTASILCNEYKYINQRNNSDCDLYDVEMQEFRLAVSSDDTEIFSDNEKLQKGGCKMSVKAVTETKGCLVDKFSDAQSNKLDEIAQSDKLYKNKTNECLNKDIPDLSKKNNHEAKNTKDITLGDDAGIDRNIVKMNNERENVDVKKPEPFKQHIHKPKPKSRKAIVSSDDNKSTNNVSDKNKSVPSTLKSDEENKLVILDKDIPKLSKHNNLKPILNKEAGVSSDENKGTNNVSDNDKSMSSTLNTDDQNVYDECSDTEIHQLSKQQKSQLNSKKAIVSSDEDDYTNNVIDNDKSMTLKLKSNNENEHSKLDKNLPEFSNQHIKPKTKSKQAIVSYDEDKVTNNVSDNDSMSSTLKSDEENVHDKLDKVIPELSQKQKIKPKSKKTIISGDEEEGTNNASNIDKSMSSTLKRDQENKHDTLDTDIPEHCKKQKPKPKSKKATVSSHEDEGTNNVSDNDKSMSSTLKSDEENVHDKLDKVIPALSQKQKLKPKSKKAIISGDEEEGTNNASDNEKSMSSTLKSNEENEHDELDKDIPELFETQKPKPKSMKATVSSDEDKGTNNVSDNDTFKSLTSKTNQQNDHDKCPDTEIPVLLEQQMLKTKSKKAIVSTDEDTGTKNISDNDKSLSLTPKSNKENEHDKCLMKEVPELSKQYKNKNKNKTAIVSNEKYTEARDASAIDFIDANQRDTDKGKEAIGSGSEGNIVCRTDNENAMSDGCVDESENSSLYQDIPEQNTDISKNVDATCSLSKKDKLISHSHRKEVSSCDRKTMNDLLGRKNIGAEENTNNSSEQVTMKNKTEKNTGLHENIEDEFAKSLNDQKCKTPTLSPSPDTEVAHSGIEEIILSDTDSEPNRANDVKENDEKKVFIKCVDISKLTCQVAAKPLNMDHKKKVTNKVKDKTSDKMVTLKKTSSMPACKSVKPMVKLREFSVKVCRMQTFDQTFLKKHKLKVIKNFKTKQVVAELKQAERNERAKNDLLGDSSSSASIGRKVEPTNTTKSPSSASKRKRQRRIMRAKERLMSVSSTDTEEELVQNALKKIKRELRLSQTDKSSNELSPKKRLNKQSPYKLSSETDEMVQKALKIVSNQIKNVKYLGDSKIRDSSESDRMGRSLRRNRGNAQCEQEGTDKEENNKSPDSVIENLTNLKNIKKTARGHATSSSDDGHQAKKFKKRTSPILDEKKCEAKSDSEDEESIEEQIKSNDDVNIIEDNDDSDSLPDMPKVFRTNGKSNADLAKQELLRDSEDTSATDKADDEPSNYAHKEEKSSTDEEQQDEKKKANGRNSGKKTRSRSDRLLRGKLDLPSSSDERNSSTSGGKQQKAKVDSDKDGSEYEKAKSDSDSDDSVDFKRTAKRKPMHKKSSEKESDDSSKSSSDGQTKKKRRRIKVVAESDASDHSDSGSEGEGGKKSGRKNIRKVIRKDQLEEATKKAAREERERVARIQDRQKLYNNTAFDESGKPDEVVLDKVVLDFDPETKEPLISVDPGLVKKLKPHQANGIKFMWDACFESVKQIKKGKGSGCILAHCMGLGKTLQVVTLTHTLLAHWELTKVRRVLVVCPLSTVLNWVNEFRMWLKLADNDIELNIFELSKFKQNYERSNQMEEWMECGGVCVLGYEMFRNLSADNPKKFRKKMLRIFQESLVDPGPDLVVCDEGHLLKNEKTSLSQSMNRIKTIRRIVLTGTPLQNNLKEYYCMVQFVKQNLLGKYNEYLNRFVNPITNGQYTDSTDHDIRIMKRRSHVLHKLLDGAVQRRDYGVLAPFLPPKHEYIIFITLTDVQIKLYTYYLENLSRRPQPDRKSTSFLFPDFQAMQRIWTHPLVLKANSDRYEILQQKKRDKEDDEDSEGSLINFIDDESTTEEETTEESSEESVASDDSRPKRVKPKKKNKKHNKKARSTRANPVKPPEPSPEKEVVVEQKSENWTEWWMPLVTDEQLEDMRNSNKLLLLFQILKECEAIGDKLLVFSQSLYSLDLIEHFLGKIDEATQSGQSEENLAGHIGSWSEGLDYFRLDGQTSCENRSLWCKSFNRESNPRARLFLISTRAGGLGINLVAANRVVIFDMSWNPSHDVQSIFRVYRFGQKKPCYIYRFLAMGTMEEKIYERQVTKQAISKRVIDEQQIDRHYAENDLAELYQFTPRPDKPREVPLVPKDRLFAEMLKTHEDAIYKYHEHDSLLENKEEETLTEEERKAAWDDFENEKNRPPPPPMNYNQNYNGINNIMNPNSVAFVALANMLRRDYPQLTDQQLAAMMPSILYQADPSIMNSLMNSQYANTAMQPNLMMNPGGGMGAVGGMSGAAVGGMSSAAVGGSALRGALGGAMGGALAYQPVWQQQQQMQLQRLMQQQQQQQKSQAGMKFYAGGLGSRDPISMAMQQQKQREMILGGGASAGGILPNSNLPTRGRPPKPKPTMNNEVVTLDDSD